MCCFQLCIIIIIMVDVRKNHFLYHKFSDRTNSPFLMQIYVQAIIALKYWMMTGVVIQIDMVTLVGDSKLIRTKQKATDPSGIRLYTTSLQLLGL